MNFFDLKGRDAKIYWACADQSGSSYCGKDRRLNFSKVNMNLADWVALSRPAETADEWSGDRGTSRIGPCTANGLRGARGLRGVLNRVLVPTPVPHPGLEDSDYWHHSWVPRREFNAAYTSPSS